MGRLTLTRGAFAFFAACLLILGIHAAAVRGLADANYTSARIALEAAGSKPSPAALAAARSGIDEALRFEPSNPHFVEQSALLHERQALLFDRGDARARKLLGQSLAEFRAAAQMRPGSAYAWASIAMVKLRLRELDEEFYGAIDRAVRLGPWEAQVQVAIAQVGLAAWRRLAPPAQAQVIGMLERGLQRQGAEMRRIATSYDNFALVCANSPLPPRLAALCVKM